MSELIQKNEGRDFRWTLLAGTSTLVLLGYIATVSAAGAEGADRPSLWIELGGQLSRIESGQEAYNPPFVALTPSNLASPLQAERSPRYGWDENVALMFEPRGSDWTFSASIRYGRSNNSKHIRQQTYPTYFTAYSKFRRSRSGVVFSHTNVFQVAPKAARFSDTAAQHNESHTILDFQTGKDLGIGIFGRHSQSVMDFGVRFAQFASKTVIDLKENPDWQFKPVITSTAFSYNYPSYHYSFRRTNEQVYQPYHSFAGRFRANRSFTGFGPSISWKASEPLVVNSEDRALMFDWGVNASILFGRQKAMIHHQTTSLFHSTYAGPASKVTVYRHPVMPDHLRSRGVVVPNIGAFAGLSVKYPNVKVSFGYKADFFFGAMDGGIDVRRTEDVGFHGPYASVSIGLGG